MISLKQRIQDRGDASQPGSPATEGPADFGVSHVHVLLNRWIWPTLRKLVKSIFLQRKCWEDGKPSCPKGAEESQDQFPGGFAKTDRRTTSKFLTARFFHVCWNLWLPSDLSGLEIGNPIVRATFFYVFKASRCLCSFFLSFFHVVLFILFRLSVRVWG